VNGWTVADVARHHDVTRQHIYQWRGEMRREGLRRASDTARFLPVEMSAAPEFSAEPGGASAEITVMLCATVGSCDARTGSGTWRWYGWCGCWRRHDRAGDRGSGVSGLRCD
jgi:hypothetical protein